MTWESERSLALDAAKKAGEYLRQEMSKEKEILNANDRDIKLQADSNSEEIILSLLKESQYAVLAEESGEHGEVEDEKPIWIVDPLDGTMNFSREIPLSCVSIALSVAGRPVLGVIYDFNHEECFSGIVNLGARLNNDPIAVSDISCRSQAVIASGFPTYRSYSADSLGEFISQVQQFKKVRFLGTAALSMAYVACGRMDAYSEDGILYWDVAAGAAIVEAAGGYVEMTQAPQSKWARLVRCGASKDLWPEDSR